MAVPAGGGTGQRRGQLFLRSMFNRGVYPVAELQTRGQTNVPLMLFPEHALIFSLCPQSAVTNPSQQSLGTCTVSAEPSVAPGDQGVPWAPHGLFKTRGESVRVLSSLKPQPLPLHGRATCDKNVVQTHGQA